MIDEDLLAKITPGKIEHAAYSLIKAYEESDLKQTPMTVGRIAQDLLGYRIEQGHREWFSSHDNLGGISFDEKIIFVSPNAEFNDGRYDFTIAHEIGHHILHRPLFRQANNLDETIVCYHEKYKTELEHQADSFAAALLMPRKLLAKALILKKRTRPVISLRAALTIAQRVREECGITHISRSAIVNRLKDLGYIAENIPQQHDQAWRKSSDLGLWGVAKRRASRFLTRFK